MPDAIGRRGTVAQPRTPSRLGVWRRETPADGRGGRGISHLAAAQARRAPAVDRGDDLVEARVGDLVADARERNERARHPALLRDPAHLAPTREGHGVVARAVDDERRWVSAVD